ncbi:MAG: three-Cys-motif partner protein TcmP [Gammaproteobacteria bacterium]|nr:three-Cys-motif partner protein TcmP [Gammaproteobacteria bacterium]MYF60220.1 three-Cys-motif partner protein TcmP [Gammaproteobacteria bacterium]MYI22432.1 three-Cys-motif partner protein TcmP [Gammaproteobacteria bacterium]
MAPPKATLWRRGDHTEGKHLVLQHYFEAWFPILGMGRRNQRILFIDGFAGPGEYQGGEEGSPLVAMRVLSQHSSRSRIRAEVVFVFIEKDPTRAQHLERLVAGWTDKPPNAKPFVLTGSFSSRMSQVLDQLDRQKQRMAPALVMVDPFGIRDIPMHLMSRILGNPQCEVYVTFMWESINRHLSTDEFAPHLTALFGTDTWKRAKNFAGEERRRRLYALYKSQLKRAGAKQVVHFHLFRRNRLKYSIFFGTGHTKGSDCMKRAIWKIDPFGEFSFRGGENEQIVLSGLAQPNFTPLRRALQDRFSTDGWVPVKKVVEFVSSDATIYHSGQVKGVQKPGVLKPMEQQGLLRVKPQTRQRNFTYPDRCRIRFLPSSQP